MPASPFHAIVTFDRIFLLLVLVLLTDKMIFHFSNVKAIFDLTGDASSLLTDLTVV